MHDDAFKLIGYILRNDGCSFIQTCFFLCVGPGEQLCHWLIKCVEVRMLQPWATLVIQVHIYLQAWERKGVAQINWSGFKPLEHWVRLVCRSNELRSKGGDWVIGSFSKNLVYRLFHNTVDVVWIYVTYDVTRDILWWRPFFFDFRVWFCAGFKQRLNCHFILLLIHGLVHFHFHTRHLALSLFD